jgi:hypothetical protein
LNVDPSHYITSVFGSGPVSPYGVNEWYQVADEPVAAGVDLVGTWVEAPYTGKPALMALSQGADLIGGGTAPGRRVQIPMGSGQGATPVDINGLTNDGRTIIKRAIEWAGGAGCGVSMKVLLVVGDATTLSSKDAGRKDLMQSWCFTVTLIEDGESQAAFDAAAAAADVVYVSGTIAGGTLLDKLTGSPAPIVNEFNGKLDNFGFSSGTSVFALSDAFSKTDPAHHITSPFSGNPVSVFTSSLTMSVPGGTLAPDLQTAAEISGMPALVTLAAGAQRYDGNPAPARRVHLPFASAETTELTPDGKTLMRRALEWGAGAGADTGGGGGGSCDGDFGDDFETDDYGGSTGSLSWAGPWEQVNENGSPGNGDEQVITQGSGNHVLRVQDNDSGGEGVRREADLSPYASATLNFTYWRDALDDANDYVTVQVSSNGGGSWTELGRFEGPATDPEESPQSASYDISSFMGPSTQIQFLSSPDLGALDAVYFDDVEIVVSGCAP